MNLVLFNLGRLSQDWEILDHVVHVRQRAGDLQSKVGYGSDDAQFGAFESRLGNVGLCCSSTAARC
jgi:hypothetical protein